MTQSLATPIRRFLFVAGQGARSTSAGALQKAVTGNEASNRCQSDSGAVMNGWGGRIRTLEWRNQNPLP
jgi:hypothetical protein